MTTDRPPLLMAHIDPGIGANISMCVRGVGSMCVVKIFLTINVIDTQTQQHSKGYIQIWTKQKIKGKREHN